MFSSALLHRAFQRALQKGQDADFYSVFELVTLSLMDTVCSTLNTSELLSSVATPDLGQPPLLAITSLSQT